MIPKLGSETERLGVGKGFDYVFSAWGLGGVGMPSSLEPMSVSRSCCKGKRPLQRDTLRVVRNALVTTWGG